MKNGKTLCAAVAAASILSTGCGNVQGNHNRPRPLPIEGARHERNVSPTAFRGSIGSARHEKYVAMFRQLEQADARIRELEERLSASENEVVQLRLQVEQAPDTASGSSVVPVSAPAEAPSFASGGSPPAAAPVAAALSEDDQSRLVIAALRDELATEREKREELQERLERLRQETSSNPFQNQSDAELTAARRQIQDLRSELADQRARSQASTQAEGLRQAQQAELENARDRMRTLEDALQTQRRERDELIAKYEALRAQQQSAGASEADGVALREELATLKQQHQAVLASIRGDLDASRQREQELRVQLTALQQSSNGDGVSSTRVAALEAENEALQARIDEAHRQNEQLAAKLQVATRVADLIFKMQAEQQR